MTVRGHLEDITADGRIILKCTLQEEDRRIWTGFVWPRIESLITTAWRAIRWRTEETASRYEG
jgi:hypothetical protein